MTLKHLLKNCVSGLLFVSAFHTPFASAASEVTVRPKNISIGTNIVIYGEAAQEIFASMTEVSEVREVPQSTPIVRVTTFTKTGSNIACVQLFTTTFSPKGTDVTYYCRLGIDKSGNTFPDEI